LGPEPLEVSMTLNQVIFVLLAILMIWWPIGGLINRRRGQAWLAWLHTGVKEFGASSASLWLKAFHTVGQLKVSDLRPPFQSIDILFTLESRDNLPLWILQHLRGRRDEMIIQAELQANPLQELEVGFRGRRSFDSYLAKQTDNPFTQLPEQDGFRIARRGERNEEAIIRLRKFLTAEGQVIQRMSLQRAVPEDQSKWSPRQGKHLLLRADMTRMDKNSPTAFFAILREWAADLEYTENQSTVPEQIEPPNPG
jgi:hypothetical protein